jgi:hypothetical protein
LSEHFPSALGVSSLVEKKLFMSNYISGFDKVRLVKHLCQYSALRRYRFEDIAITNRALKGGSGLTDALCTEQQW